MSIFFFLYSDNYSLFRLYLRFFFFSSFIALIYSLFSFLIHSLLNLLKLICAHFHLLWTHFYSDFKYNTCRANVQHRLIHFCHLQKFHLNCQIYFNLNRRIKSKFFFCLCNQTIDKTLWFGFQFNNFIEFFVKRARIWMKKEDFRSWFCLLPWHTYIMMYIVAI